MSTYGRDEVIADIAKLIAGLQVPASLDAKVMLGMGAEPWHNLFTHLHTFGWTDAEQIEKELRAVLDTPTSKPERNIKLWLRLPDTGWEMKSRYSSVPSAQRAVRKWHGSHSAVSTYIQQPGDPDPTEDMASVIDRVAETGVGPVSR